MFMESLVDTLELMRLPDHVGSEFHWSNSRVPTITNTLLNWTHCLSFKLNNVWAHEMMLFVLVMYFPIS